MPALIIDAWIPFDKTTRCVKNTFISLKDGKCPEMPLLF
jgi:hypothetical protein